VLDASPDVTRWEKIRRAVSLIVTVAIAIALGLAVVSHRARREQARRAAAGHSSLRLVVVDAREDTGTRDEVDRAVAEARRTRRRRSKSPCDDADGWAWGLTDDAVLVESALGRLASRGTAIRRAGGVRRRIRALHY
jgi:hypothetical protein